MKILKIYALRHSHAIYLLIYRLKLVISNTHKLACMMHYKHLMNLHTKRYCHLHKKGKKGKIGIEVIYDSLQHFLHSYSVYKEEAFDDASDPTSVSIRTLMKLPFWDNFQRNQLLHLANHCQEILLNTGLSW